jgi:hypothetical protein
LYVVDQLCHYSETIFPSGWVHPQLHHHL